MLHRTLERQVKKYFPDTKVFSAEMTRFFQTVSDTYESNDQDRELIERSLDLSSKELVGINEKMAKEASALNEKSEELERFNKLMIGRELQMIELKRQIKELQEKLGQTS
jgi:hypothetical protein